MSPFSRRRFLTLSGLTIATGFLPHVSSAKNLAKPIRELKGKVWINGTLATMDSTIKSGDALKTGRDSRVIFVLGEDVFKLGERSRLKVKWRKESRFGDVSLVAGSLMGVFGKGDRKIHTHSATMGIRGTGIFIQVDNEKTYFCTCYGKTSLDSPDGTVKGHITETSYHKAYWVKHPDTIAEGETEILSSAPMLYHDDEELVQLESFVGRTPPASFKK